jgi:hypothetical protein
MNVANATHQEVCYRVQHETPSPRPLSAGDAVAIPESWTVEFYLGNRILAQRTVFDPAAVVRLVERNGAFDIEVTDSQGRPVDMERLIEAMLPATVPSPVAVLQARRNALAREEIVQEFGALTSAQVADLAGSRAANKAALAHRWRQEGRIFSVPHRGTNYFLGFQFDEQGQPIPAVADVIRRLGGRMSEWGLALWLTASNGWLGDKRPVDLLRVDPEAVVRAADEEAAGVVF